MNQHLTSEAEGKRVIDPDGGEVGIVKTVDGGLAYIKPNPSLPETVASKLGWGAGDRHTYPLDKHKIERMTADEVRLEASVDFATD